MPSAALHLQSFYENQHPTTRGYYNRRDWFTNPSLIQLKNAGFLLLVIFFGTVHQLLPSIHQGRVEHLSFLDVCIVNSFLIILSIPYVFRIGIRRLIAFLRLLHGRHAAISDVSLLTQELSDRVFIEPPQETHTVEEEEVLNPFADLPFRSKTHSVIFASIISVLLWVSHIFSIFGAYSCSNAKIVSLSCISISITFILSYLLVKSRHIWFVYICAILTIFGQIISGIGSSSLIFNTNNVTDYTKGCISSSIFFFIEAIIIVLPKFFAPVENQIDIQFFSFIIATVSLLFSAVSFMLALIFEPIKTINVSNSHPLVLCSLAYACEIYFLISLAFLQGPVYAAMGLALRVPLSTIILYFVAKSGGLNFLLTCGFIFTLLGPFLFFFQNFFFMNSRNLWSQSPEISHLNIALQEFDADSDHKEKTSALDNKTPGTLMTHSPKRTLRSPSPSSVDNNKYATAIKGTTYLMHVNLKKQHNTFLSPIRRLSLSAADASDPI